MKFKELKQDIKLQEFRQNNSKLPRIYCDMDGVLCNFEQAAEKAVGMPLSQWAKNLTKIQNNKR